MEKRSHRRIRDLGAHTAFQGLDANEIGCARISIMAGERDAPFKGPNTDERDQSSPNRSHPACNTRPVHTEVPCVDGCAGRPAEGRRCKSVTVKAQRATPTPSHARAV